MERETGLEPATVQLGKTTVNWKQRTLRFQHLVLAIENSPVSILCSAHLPNGAQMEHTELDLWTDSLTLLGRRFFGLGRKERGPALKARLSLLINEVNKLVRLF